MNLVLKSTSIYDSVGDAPFAGYIEIEGEKIKKVVKGETDIYNDAEKYQLIDCGDKTITPGLCDGHIHLFLGSLHAATVDVFDVTSEEDAARMIYDHYKDKDDEWLLAFRWSNWNWDDDSLPTKASLDKYFPDRPVIAYVDELHAVWVNSKTLELCGITKDTPDPPGGEIFRDENGEPTGYLLEQPAMELVSKAALTMPVEKEEELIKNFMKVAHSRGVTTVGAVQVMRIMKHETCKRLEDKDEMKIRVFFAPHMDQPVEDLVKLKEEYNSDKLAFIGVKDFLDGTPLGYNGYMVEEYADRPGFFSEPLVDPAWLEEKSKELYRNGISMRLHACGDGAVRLALDAYEAARKEYGPRDDVRNTIEHIEVLHRDDLPRFAETGTIASIQPAHILMPTLEGHPIFDIVKPDRVPLCWPGKSLVEAGATVAFGTDYPIVELDHSDSLYRAVKRRMMDDLPEEGWNPQEKFTVAEAIRNHTYGVAYMLNHDNIIGTLEEGKLADINVFNKNIFADEEELPNMKCSMTVFNGEIVYKAD